MAKDLKESGSGGSRGRMQKMVSKTAITGGNKNKPKPNTYNNPKHASIRISGNDMDFTHYKGARRGTGQFSNITVEKGKKTTYKKVSALDAASDKNFEEYLDRIENPTVMKTVSKKKKFGTKWEKKREKEISTKKAKKQVSRKLKKG